MDTLLQEKCGGRMAQVVEADMGKPCFIEQWPKGTAQEIARFHRLADLVRKDQVMIFPRRPETESYGGLPAAMLAQGVECGQFSALSAVARRVAEATYGVPAASQQ